MIARCRSMRETKQRVVRPEGLEPPAYWFEASRSIQLSYGRAPHPSYHCCRVASMAFEIEIKVRCRESAFETRRKLERFGYQIIEPRTLESDRVFDRANQELKRADQLPRPRSAGRRPPVTNKAPGVRARHKTREEIEFDVSNRDHFLAVLDRLGYSQYF